MPWKPKQSVMCVNGCGAAATKRYDLAEYELRDGRLQEWRAAGRKFFCDVCAPSGARAIGLKPPKLTRWQRFWRWLTFNYDARCLCEPCQWPDCRYLCLMGPGNCSGDTV